MRALALQTLAKSQDYIRTVARTAITDKTDPAMKAALTEAARDVVMKDDKIVFAIRKGGGLPPQKPCHGRRCSHARIHPAQRCAKHLHGRRSQHRR